MIVDFKFHLVSIISVFLALAIGILVGSTMIGSDIIAQQQKEIVNKLEDDFSKLRKENINLHSQVQQLDNQLALDKQFQKLTLPLLLENRLIGHSIALVFTEPDYYGSSWQKGMVASLKEAGANIYSLTALSLAQNLNNPQKRQDLAANLNLNSQGKKEMATFLGENLAQEIVGIRNRDSLAVLERLGLAKITWGTENKIDSIVLVGGRFSSGGDELDQALVKEWKKLGLKVIGVEASQVKLSFMGLYQKLGLATVDNIDTVSGQVSLVYLLQENRIGHYGFKPTADRILPEIF